MYILNLIILNFKFKFCLWTISHIRQTRRLKQLNLKKKKKNHSALYLLPRLVQDKGI